MQKTAKQLEEIRTQEIKLADEIQIEVDTEIDNQIKAEKEEGIDELDEKCSNCGGAFDGGNCYWCKMD